MQLEGGLAAAAAVLEMLAHTSRGVLRVFPAVPAGWQDVSFSGIRTEGALLVSAQRQGGVTAWVQLTSEAGAPIRLANPWGDDPVAIRQDGVATRHIRGRVLDLAAAAGATLTIDRPSR